MERVINVAIAKGDAIKITDGFIFHDLSKAGFKNFVKCIFTVMDHLKVHFQQDLARTDHIHLMNLSNMLIQIAIDVKRRNYHQMVYLFI